MHCLRVIGTEIQKLRGLMEVEANRETNRSAVEVQPPSEDTVDNADRSED
jgi:copper chaperone CopZ